MADDGEIIFHVAAPQPATSYYIPKVIYERRIRTASASAYVMLDAIRIAVQNRPQDWATSTVAPWPTYVGYGLPFVFGIIDYIGADQVNVMDPGQGALLGLLQAEEQVFGSNAATASAAIATILTPAPLPGEPTS